MKLGISMALVGLSAMWVTGAMAGDPMNGGSSGSGSGVPAEPVFAGTIYNDGCRHPGIAAYWKDGRWTELSASQHELSSQSFSASVSDGHVYVAGDLDTDDGASTIGGYWLDGIWHGFKIRAHDPYHSEKYYSHVAGVKEVGGHVYAAGAVENSCGDRVAAYWVDGKRTQLDSRYPHSTYGASGMDVDSEGHIYVTGGYWENLSNGHIRSHLGYWRDKKFTPIEVTSEVQAVDAIQVVDGRVYLAGYTMKNDVPDDLRATPGYWTEGKWHALDMPSKSKIGWAIAIVFSGGHLYVGGTLGKPGVNDYNENIPGYWKDGKWVSLNFPGDYEGGYVRSMQISDEGRVTVGGAIFTRGFERVVPGYWRDGVWTALSTSSTCGAVSSIAFH